MRYRILSRKRTNELVKDNIHAENVDVNVSNWLRDEFPNKNEVISVLKYRIAKLGMRTN